MTGQRLLHYEITDKLGEGGMGVVYKARDTHLDRFVAVKVLPADKVTDPTRKARFVQEAKAASALNHPNIITVYDISADAGTDFIAMEYVDGKTLDQIIPRDGMRLGEALKIAIQIADALARAHFAGIVHRDLKPANIMVDGHGHVKVLDFGLAKLTEVSTDDRTVTMQTAEGAIVGTAAYMSPEQAEGLPVDVRSDIFSFGAVLYEMLSGECAFRGESSISTLAAILHREPTALDTGIPGDLRKLISRCLRKDPDRRFQHMSDLRVALVEVAEEQQSDASAAETPAPPARRGRQRWLPVALLGLLVVSGLLSWTLLRRTDPAPPIEIAPLTAYAGSEVMPSFSPDSRRVVFTWNGPEGGQDLFVRLLGAPNYQRLTFGKSPAFGPAWSPDGSTIVFARKQGSNAVLYSIPSIAGPEKVIRSIEVGGRPMPGRCAFASWSPDGKWLALATGDLLNLATNELRKLYTPGSANLDSCPAFSPDGRALAYAHGEGAFNYEIMVQDLTGDYRPAGPPRQITHLKQISLSPAWLPEGKDIVFVSSVVWAYGGYLYRVPAAGNRPAELLPFTTQSIRAVVAARQPGRLAFVQNEDDFNILRVPLASPDRVAAEPEEFIASTRMDFMPSYSPDGSRLAFSSNRHGSYGIWTCAADGADPVELFSRPASHAHRPGWSPDGSSLVFAFTNAGRRNALRIPSEGGLPQPLTDTNMVYDPVWSADGKWVYFTQIAVGPPQIWKMPGGPAVQVTRDGGYATGETGDGRILFYLKAIRNPSSIWQVPVQGGTATQLFPEAYGYQFHVSRSGLYFMAEPEPGAGQYVRFYDFRTRQTVSLTRVRPRAGFGVAVSPDEKTLLFTVDAGRGSDIMLVENFR